MGLNTRLFSTFFRIGIGTIGGGYAMIPMMEYEVVTRHGWLEQSEFVDILAVAQTAPGVFAVNMSSLIGQRLGGLRSALVATVANILPSILVILSIAMFFRLFRENVWVEYAFRAVRPVVVSLIAAPVFTMARSARISWQTVWIPIVVAGLIWLFGVSPIYIVLAAGLLGLAYGWYTQHTNV